MLSTNRFRPDGLKEKGEMDKEGLCDSIVSQKRVIDLRLDALGTTERGVKKQVSV